MAVRQCSITSQSQTLLLEGRYWEVAQLTANNGDDLIMAHLK